MKINARDSLSVEYFDVLQTISTNTSWYFFNANPEFSIFSVAKYFIIWDNKSKYLFSTIDRTRDLMIKEESCHSTPVNISLPVFVSCSMTDNYCYEVWDLKSSTCLYKLNHHQPSYISHMSLSFPYMSLSYYCGFYLGQQIFDISKSAIPLIKSLEDDSKFLDCSEDYDHKLLSLIDDFTHVSVSHNVDPDSNQFMDDGMFKIVIRNFFPL